MMFIKILVLISAIIVLLILIFAFPVIIAESMNYWRGMKRGRNDDKRD